MVRLFSIAASAVLATSFVSSSPTSGPNYATYINFATDDILDNDDGLPPHPLQGLPYGKPTYPLTVDGNGREQVEAHLNYFEGKYWMHSATWGCGGNIFVYGIVEGINFPESPIYPPGRYGEKGNCGIKSYSSPDLTNWTLETFYQPDITVANVTKPVVRYSNATGNYVMYMGSPSEGNFYYTTSKSPGGPWSNPPRTMTGAHINHDFDVAVGPDGSHYIVSDPFTEMISFNGYYTLPIWDIWVQKLAPNLTATVGTNETSARIRTARSLYAQGLHLEAASFFYHNGYWYMMFGRTCQNCAGPIYYLYAKNPLGPYIDGGFVSLDGCGGQNKGANVLPSAKGPIVVAGNLGYRTSPTDIVVNGSIWHGDNHQAASSTFFFPVEFNRDHTIKDYTCPPTVQIPLASNIHTQPESPISYQLDGRIRNWQTIEAIYDPPKSGSRLEFPVWQRTDNLGQTTNAGPMLDGLLQVTVEFSDGNSTDFSWSPRDISWAPAKIAMDVSGKQISKIILSTNATNGCFGTLVEPKKSDSNYGSRVRGAFKDSPKAELYVYQF
ncbi:uncharacterized protein PFLUO_LOCUS1549 [Penicillium psychrofluorescens]|uniref:uncharacterized protein n=1 Tax=Penicillium psychrofluorescens TaxID=3158075 RepID=UPI003CCDFCA4